MSLDPRPVGVSAGGGLKLTLRMKNEHNNQYEVLRRPESKNGAISGDDVTTALSVSGNVVPAPMENKNPVKPWREVRKREKKNRKREISNSSTGSNGSGLKRLKLRLGDETMSTIDLDTSG